MSTFPEKTKENRLAAQLFLELPDGKQSVGCMDCTFAKK
jgi:hypothetical protein